MKSKQPVYLKRGFLPYSRAYRLDVAIYLRSLRSEGFKITRHVNQDGERLYIPRHQCCEFVKIGKALHLPPGLLYN